MQSAKVSTPTVCMIPARCCIRTESCMLSCLSSCMQVWMCPLQRWASIDIYPCASIRALSVVSAQGVPTFASNDGGVRSRLAFLHLPLEFVPNPEPCVPNQRLLETGVKASTGSPVAEVLYGAPHLMPELINDQKRSRFVLPRLLTVTEDTDQRYMATCGEPEPT